MQRTSTRITQDSTTHPKRFAPPRNWLEDKFNDTPHADALLAVLQSGAAFRHALASLLAVRGPLMTDGGEDLRECLTATHYTTGLLVDNLASEMPGAAVCVFWGVARDWPDVSAADVHPDATV